MGTGGGLSPPSSGGGEELALIGDTKWRGGGVSLAGAGARVTREASVAAVPRRWRTWSWEWGARAARPASLT